jgi:hypothetical protein
MQGNVTGTLWAVLSWIRGRIVVLKVRREQRARLTLQCFGRRCLSRQVCLQRKFIFKLISTADIEKTKKVAANLIQDQFRSHLDDRKRDESAHLDDQKRDEAACVIQRFFLMVKREVDRMVRESKKRRRRKKKKENLAGRSLDQRGE